MEAINAGAVLNARPRKRGIGLLSSPSLVAGIVLISILAAIAAAAPAIAPPGGGTMTSAYVPRYGLAHLPKPPSAEHPLGLLSGQYDNLYALVWGTRKAFQYGLLVAAGRAIAGVAVGLLSGFYGRWLDAVLMRITDAFLAFPIVAAVMVMLSVYGSEAVMGMNGTWRLAPGRQEDIVAISLVVFGWMPYARLMRGNLLSEREREYVQAARATGARDGRLLMRHLLPNSMQGLFVLAASDIGAIVVLFAAFSFIGLITPPFGELEADWGQILAESRDWIIGGRDRAFQHWYTYMPVSAAIVLFSVGWNLIGDGLRDLLDPRRGKRVRGL